MTINNYLSTASISSSPSRLPICSTIRGARHCMRRVMGFTEALQEAESTQNSAESLQLILSIRVSVERMNTLIDALLKLAQFSHAEINQQAVNLSEIVGLVAGELQQSDPTRRVEFVIADGIVVNGDNQLLRIAMENLLGNAWKFTSKRQDARIEVGFMSLNGENAYFVRDNGAGFEMKFAHKLFSPFQRLHTASEFEGTGIGLATVQRIIHRHGGRVWAESDVEQGATFYFTLPGKA